MGPIGASRGCRACVCKGVIYGRCRIVSRGPDRAPSRSYVTAEQRQYMRLRMPSPPITTLKYQMLVGAICADYRLNWPPVLGSNECGRLTSERVRQALCCGGGMGCFGRLRYARAAGKDGRPNSRRIAGLPMRLREALEMFGPIRRWPRPSTSSLGAP